MKLKWGWNRTLFLPVVAVALLMVQAEWNASNGTVYRIQVSGYDPRDLVYGHYLQIQYELGSLGVSQTELLETHMVCLHVEEGELTASHGLPESLEDVSCAARIPAENLLGPKRYLVPEADARELEAYLQNQKMQASVDLIVQENGDVSMGMLYLDGAPWRSVLDESESGPPDTEE